MKQWMLLMCLLATLSSSVPSTLAITYSQWLAEHKCWAKLFPERAKFLTRHPAIAERCKSEWADWKEERVSFSDWSSKHPDWVRRHRERAWFLHTHPDAAEKLQNEWLFAKEEHPDFEHWLKDRVAFVE